MRWIAMLWEVLEDSPREERAVVEQLLPLYGDKFLPAEYGL